MRARGFIGALALVCLAATSPPPLPHTPASHYRHAQGVTQGAGAQALIAKIALPPSATLTWRWTPNPGNDWSNVVFVVLTSGNVTAKNWTLAGVAATNAFPVVINRTVPAEFFAVVASNTVTHLVNE